MLFHKIKYDQVRKKKLLVFQAFTNFNSFSNVFKMAIERVRQWE